VGYVERRTISREAATAVCDCCHRFAASPLVVGISHGLHRGLCAFATSWLPNTRYASDTQIHGITGRSLSDGPNFRDEPSFRVLQGLKDAFVRR
jgi:hypothetical protein